MTSKSMVQTDNLIYIYGYESKLGSPILDDYYYRLKSVGYIYIYIIYIHESGIYSRNIPQKKQTLGERMGFSHSHTRDLLHRNISRETG